MDKYFKTSQKSICHDCFNVSEKCSMFEKTCGTDSKIGQSFVKSCTMFNKENKTVEYRINTVSAHLPDSRIEMMGGGFQNVDKYKEI